MRERYAFTLIELLVVIAIIALLVSILVPSLTKARDMAKKAVCSTTMSNHGKSVAMYMSRYDSYPHLAPWPWMYPQLRLLSEGTPTDATNGWPKFYGVLETNDLAGAEKTTWGVWYYDGAISEIWDGCLCPAMDAPAILMAANNAGNFPYNGNFMYWVWYHKWAIGFQWSPYLRAATPLGRHPNRLDDEQGVDMWQWIGCRARLPDGSVGWTQAINPDELSQPSDIAEAWDSWDLDSAPNIPWETEYQNTRGGAVTPGWHAGVATASGRAVLNGYRHKGSPNILYADGHVSADANRPIDPASDGLPLPDYEGLHAYTWSNYSMRWGNLDHLVPNCEWVGD